MAKVSDKKAVARLSKELKKLKKKGFKGADAGPSNNSMLLWTAKIIGPKGCPYEGGKFKVQIAFTEDYPMKPPELKFLTKIYHPSVKKSDGTVCPAIIGKNWAPVLNIFYILETLQQMLLKPPTDSPLEEEIAEQLIRDKKKFDKEAKSWTKKHAK
mmetsp:Transcript_66428/g.81317  ORF Transcript_66428/g.81317 Transcript_66428/m.81317 type:complete len:156 (+) Transcript_66428:44-511(+)